MEGRKAKVGGQNEKVKLTGKRRKRKDKRGKKREVGETGKESDQVIQCKRAGRHEGHNERRNVNNRTN